MQGVHSCPGATAQGPIQSEHAIWLLGNLGSLFRVPIDRELAKHLLPPTVEPAGLADPIRELGLSVTASEWPDAHKLAQLPLPAVVFLRSLPEQTTNTPDASQDTRIPAIVVQSDGKKLALLRPDRSAPQLLPLDEAKRISEPPVLLVSQPASVPQEKPEQASAEHTHRPFGFSWFVPELLRHRSLWRDVLLAGLAIQLVGLTTPLFTQVIIDKVIPHHSQSTLLVLGVAMIFFLLFSNGMSWLRQYLIIHTGSRIDAVLGEKVMHHLLRLPQAYFEHRATGTLVARLQGIETLREFVSGAAIGLLLDLPFLLLLLAIMFSYSLPLTLIALGIVSLIVLASLLMVPVFRKRLDEQFLLGARNQAFLTEHIAGMTTVKSLQMEPGIQQRYGDYLAQYLGTTVATRQTANTYQTTASGLEQALTLSILIVGAWMLMQNPGFTVGMLIAFQMFASRLSQPLMRLVGLWQEFQQATVAVKRLADILDMPTEPYSLAPINTASGPGNIRIRHLGFRYSDHHPWLYRDLDLDLPAGQLTLLTGPSGCGKSTLARLLLGFRLPQEGQILLDGRDTRNLTANALRAAFGVVPQETVLFSGTLRDNLLMANPHASDEDIANACRAADIHDDIERLPQGYLTPVGEQGAGLSGGQRQRVAIARALLKRPRILVFDEATASLDADTAAQLASTVNRLRGKVTILFIAHQIPATLQVDQRIDLQKLGSE